MIFLSVLASMYTTSVPEIDVTIPFIALLGDNPVTMYENDTYIDAGVTAYDNVDGNITANVAIFNSVNESTIAQYIITYNVSDAAGNAAAEVTRTVNVVAQSTLVAPIYKMIEPLKNTNFLEDSTNTLSTYDGEVSFTPNVTQYPQDGTLDIGAGNINSHYQVVTDDGIYGLFNVVPNTSYEMYVIAPKAGNVADIYRGDELTPIVLTESNKAYVIPTGDWVITDTPPAIIYNSNVTPNAPTNFIASDDEVGQITFTWTNSTVGIPTPTYDLYNVAGLVTAGITSPYTEAIPAGTDTYRIKAINSQGSTDSNTDSGTSVAASNAEIVANSTFDTDINDTYDGNSPTTLLWEDGTNLRVQKTNGFGASGHVLTEDLVVGNIYDLICDVSGIEGSNPDFAIVVADSIDPVNRYSDTLLFNGSVSSTQTITQSVTIPVLENSATKWDRIEIWIGWGVAGGEWVKINSLSLKAQ